jgi:LuxR family maltose regulon positive regulatory protein
VEQGILTLRSADGEQRIVVGAPDWFQWLETATMFTFASAQRAFTARRERASSGRGGWYWRAYHDRAGVRQRVYLGVAAELSLERLEAVAAQLAVAEMPQATSGQPETGRSSALRDVGPSPATGVARPQLLATKLYLPRARPDLVARLRLFARLDAGLQGTLTLVCAPAGFGKTTLLAEWSHRAGRPVAWLGLDAGDNDPVVFLR